MVALDKWHPIPGSNLGWFYAGGALQYATRTGYLSGNAWCQQVNEKLERTAKSIPALGLGNHQLLKGA